MSAPNRREIVDRIQAEHPHLLAHNTHAACAEFEQRFIALANRDEPDPANGFGHVGKSPGENGYTFPNGVRVSHDAVFHKPSHRQVDIIHGAGAHPTPGGPTWNPIDPAEYRPHNIWTPPQPLFDSGTPTGGTVRSARLGLGWFCKIRALRDWPQDVAIDEAWADEHFGPLDYQRVFLDLEGHDHGDPDPWRDAGIDIRDATWRDDYRRLLDHTGARGREKLLLTVYGGRNHARTADQRRRNHDRIVEATDTYWPLVELVEGCNEPEVNRWTPLGVREIGGDLRRKVPAHIPVAFGSPTLAHATIDGRYATNEEMIASFDAFYHGVSGNIEVGVHLMRGDPEAKWADPFAYNGLTRFPLYNGEPFGPGASAGGDVADPRTILAGYQRTSAAKWTRYTSHCAWSVFNGRLPAEYPRREFVRHLADHPNMAAIAHALRDYRAAGVIGAPPPPPPPPPPPHASHRLERGDELVMLAALVSSNGRYTLQYQPDGNLVLYEASAGPQWASHTDGTSAGSVAMQHDGNLVVYDARGTPLWASHTEGHPGASVQLQDDGNLVIYAADGTPLWGSVTDGQS